MISNDDALYQESMENEIVLLAAHLDAASHRLLTLIREYDDSAAWSDYGLRSCAAWLSWRIGMSPGAARERVRVARTLADLPLIDAALEKGVISYSKVRALARVATPDNEQMLLDLATRATAAHLETLCRAVRVSREAREGGPLDQTEPEAMRWVRRRAGEQGMVRIEAQLQPDEAAVVMQALEQARAPRDSAESPAASSSSGSRSRSASSESDPPRPNRADGLVRVAEAWLARPNPDPERTGGDRHQLFVHLGPDVLEGGYSAELEDGTHVSAESLKRIACDTGLIPLRTDHDDQPLDVGRKTRTIPPAIRRALQVRDRGCRFPGCTHTKWVDAHHIQHWMDGGKTSLDNLILLCPRHHRLLHEGGFHLEKRGDAGFTFSSRNGAPLAEAPSPPPIPESPAATLITSHEDQGLIIDEDTNYVWWDGRALTAFDVTMCVTGID